MQMCGSGDQCDLESRSARYRDARMPARFGLRAAMTPEQIRRVQASWLKVLPHKEAAAQFFYTKLFELEPSLRSMFRGDLRAQGDKLMQVIDAAVNGLSRIERLRPVLADLGRRHVAYGVKDDHYGLVGLVLLWTLRRSLSEDFTPELQDAWASVYGALATIMREAAHSAQACAGGPEHVR